MSQNRRNPGTRGRVKKLLLESRRRTCPLSGKNLIKRNQSQRPVNQRMRLQRNREVQEVTARTMVGEEGRKRTFPHEISGKTREIAPTVLVEAITDEYLHDDPPAGRTAIAETRRKEIEIAKDGTGATETRGRQNIVIRRDHRESQSIEGMLGSEIGPAATRSQKIDEDLGSTSVTGRPMLWIEEHVLETV
jgi:hypothetical protein